MKIKKFIIKNYRNLKDISLDFNDLTIFIGKNDVGKSNILKALDLFSKWKDSSDYNEVALGGSGSDYAYVTGVRDYRLFFNQEPSNTIELTCYIELSDIELNNLFPELKTGRIEIINDKDVTRKEIGNTVEINKEIISMEGKKVIWRMNYIKMEGLILFVADDPKNPHLLRTKEGQYNYVGGGEQISTKFLNMFKDSFLLIPAVRKITKEIRSKENASAEGKSIPNEFLKYEKNISLNKKYQFEQINTHISKIFPEYSTIASMENEEDQIEIYFDEFNSSSVGEGIKQHFINVFNLTSEKNLIFGIEEPEIHLHAEAQREIFKFLKEHTKHKQIIITTHSPILTNCSDKINLYLIKKEKDKTTKIKNIKEQEEFKLIKHELGIKNTDLFFYNVVCFVEGYTEEKVIPLIANAMGHNLVEQGVKLINIKGTGFLKKIKIFLKYLEDSDIGIYVILDKDNSIEGDIRDLIRENLLKEKNYKIWEEGEFEDCFGEERIIKAMQEIAKEDTFKFEMTVDELKELKTQNNKPITKILKDYLAEKNLPELNKLKLGEKLGLIIAREIAKKMKREQTEPEKVIERLFELAK